MSRLRLLQLRSFGALETRKPPDDPGVTQVVRDFTGTSLLSGFLDRPFFSAYISKRERLDQ